MKRPELKDSDPFAIDYEHETTIYMDHQDAEIKRLREALRIAMEFADVYAPAAIIAQINAALASNTEDEMEKGKING